MSNSRGRPSKEKSRDTKQIIMNVSLRLFATIGFAGTSISNIAREVGIGKSGIYAHFKSKDEILLTLMKSFGPGLVTSIEKTFDLDEIVKNPKVGIKKIGLKILEEFSTDKARLFKDLVFTLGADPRYRLLDDLKAGLEETLKSFSIIVERLMKDQVISDEFDSEFLAWEFLAPIASIRMIYFSSHSKKSDIKKGMKLGAKHIDYYIEKNFIIEERQ